MGKTVMAAAVSLDGFIADDDDRVGPLFDWYGNVDVAWSSAVFGSGRPFYATGRLPEALQLADPTTIVQGDRVTHLVYDVLR